MNILAVLVPLVAVILTLYAVSFAVRLGPPIQVRPFLSSAEHAVSRYHVRWYTLTMVFLAFDMEMVFMYPWTLVVSTVGTPAVVEMFLFLAVLFAGVWYAHREGALRWT